MLDSGLEGDPRRFPVSVEHINADTTERFLWLFGPQVRRSRARIAIWFWELAALPRAWISNAAQYDEIWVGSRFGRRAITAVTNVPVEIVAPPVRTPLGAEGDVRKRLGVPADAFVVLYVFDHSSFVARKNPFCLVDAFVREFGDDPTVRLILKVSHADTRSRTYRRLMETALHHPNVHIVSEVMSAAELGSLFVTADCYVSPHRSEGFGLTVAEALLCECPVIATDYGSTTDFLTAETGYPLDYSLVEIAEDHGPYARGYVWADPSTEHLQSLLRHVLDHPEEARERAKAGRRFVAAEYSPQAAGRRMYDRIRSLSCV
jgi:glycosyltransferase involved in cell wall biosynthesis